MEKDRLITPDFTKFLDGLVPAIAQDAHTGRVLMLGYMNKEALNETLASGKVTFFSRSKFRLWTKGEESGHFLLLQSIKNDCDQDALLLSVLPQGPVCHTGADTCWNERNEGFGFLQHLENTIAERILNPTEASYTASLMKRGINKVAQKVGEEAVELVIEAKDDNRELFLGEAADLIFHLLVLLKAKEVSLSEVEAVLKERHLKKR